MYNDSERFHLEETHEGADARVGDEHVEAVEGGFGCVGDGWAHNWVGDVSRDEDGARAELGEFELE